MSNLHERGSIKIRGYQSPENFSVRVVSLGEKIGEGTYANVHQGVIDKNGSSKPAAIKIAKEHNDLPFYNEITANIALVGKSERFVEFFGRSAIFQEGHAHQVMAMELLPEGSVGDQLQKKGPLPVRTAVLYAGQTAKGLHVMHENGIVHRDVKPANLLLARNNEEVKLADFGLAKTYLNKDGSPAHVGAPLPLKEEDTGLVFGTPLYMAPEVAQGAQADPRSDVVSLALTFHEMVAGESFRVRTSPQEIMRTMRNRELYEDSVDRGADILVKKGYRALEQPIRHAVERNPDRRPADPRILIKEVEDRLAEMRETKGKSIGRKYFVPPQRISS